MVYALLQNYIQKCFLSFIFIFLADLKASTNRSDGVRTQEAGWGVHGIQSGMLVPGFLLQWARFGLEDWSQISCTLRRRRRRRRGIGVEGGLWEMKKEQMWREEEELGEEGEPNILSLSLCGILPDL